MKKLSFILLALPVLIGVFAISPLPDSPEKLGEKLFFDPILSEDSTISCASCHRPEFAFADTLPFSRGVNGQFGRRNTPGITNMVARPYFFFDGRAATLEHQVMQPIMDNKEMRMSMAVMTGRLQRHPEYKAAFWKVFQHEPDSVYVSKALAAFTRTLETSDTPFDRWMQGDAKAMSEAAVRGRKIFMEKGKCFDCHFSPDFTGDEFRNVGLYTGEGQFADAGRHEVTHQPQDLGKFKVPGLRNVAVTSPFMHNGMFRTLDEVIEFYDQPDKFVKGAINRDTLLNKPLNLSLEEKRDLKAFLEALTDDRFVKK